jgi:tRNA (guanine-N7-)-methyltransferase
MFPLFKAFLSGGALSSASARSLIKSQWLFIARSLLAFEGLHQEMKALNRGNTYLCILSFNKLIIIILYMPRLPLLPVSLSSTMPELLEGLWYIPPFTNSKEAHFPPFSDPAFFGNDNPLHIEYCSGNGTWIAERAQNYPHINFLACERRLDRARKIYAKISRRPLKNLILAWAEAHALTQQFLPDACTEEIFINFPDPWPKRKDAPKRLIRRPFIDEMGRILKKGGTLHICTDDIPYSESIIDKVLDSGLFKSLVPKPYFSPPPANWGTSFFDELFSKLNKSIRYHAFSRVGLSFT